MHTQTWGNKRNPVAVLIHGLASSSHAWENIAPKLAAQGYHVIAPDLPGHGQTGPHSKYTVETMAAAVHATIGDRKVDLLVGHSLGGLISILLNEKLNPRKLALLDPVIWLPPTRLFVTTTQNVIKNAVLDIKGKHARKRPAWQTLLFEKELLNYKNWDATSSKALEARPKIVKNVFSQGTGENILVLRVKNSYITPASLPKRYKDKLVFRYMSGVGHNVHQEKPNEVYNMLKEFVGELPYVNRNLFKRVQQWIQGIPAYLRERKLVTI